LPTSYSYAGLPAEPAAHWRIAHHTELAALYHSGVVFEVGMCLKPSAQGASQGSRKSQIQQQKMLSVINESTKVLTHSGF
jgi:hypothetical protein